LFRKLTGVSIPKDKLHVKLLFKNETNITGREFYLAFEYVLENLRRLPLFDFLFNE
jgi:hypothetical protein